MCPLCFVVVLSLPLAAGLAFADRLVQRVRLLWRSSRVRKLLPVVVVR